jgi:hypothetical protein
MKFLVILILSLTISYAQYEKGKIDMHGGKEDYSYDKKGMYSKNFGVMIGVFLDKNVSKKNKSK